MRWLWVPVLLMVVVACGTGGDVVSGDRGSDDRVSDDRVSELCVELYPMITDYDDAMVDHFAELGQEAQRLGIDAAIGPLEDAAAFLVDPPPGQDESFFYQALVGISEAFADAGYERCANLAASSELAPGGPDHAAIERNRRLWDEKGPTDYVLRLSIGGSGKPVRSYAVEVEGGEPSRAFQLGFGHELPVGELADLPITVERAFELVSGGTGDAVRMDHQVGNPVSYNAGRSWFHWEVETSVGGEGSLGSALESLSDLRRDSYWLTLTVDCVCPEDEMSPLSIQTVDGAVVETRLNPRYEGTLSDHIPLTLPDLVEALAGNTLAYDVTAEWKDDTTVQLIVDPLQGLEGEEIILGVTVADRPPELGVGSVGEMQCGAITVPLSSEPPPLGDTDDPDLDLALEWFAGNEEGQFWLDGIQWSVWEKTDKEMILYGKDNDGYTSATFVKDDGSWQAAGWGECHWQVTVEGWGVAEWRLDGPADPDSTTLMLAATERNCANGKAPEGRDIESVVWETEDSVTIFIFVEPVSGAATCPGNPNFTWTVELDAPLRERRLFDGSEVPPVKRGGG